MAAALTADVLQDDLAILPAHALAAANMCACESGVDVLQSLISITQCPFNGGLVWWTNDGPKDYVNRRGGDFIVEVDPVNASITQVLRGQ